MTSGVHRRRNPLTGRHVLVSPHRLARPWQGAAEPATVDRGPAFDPDCYLCPGNPRAGGATNPDYSGVFVFDNDYPAVLPEVGEVDAGDRMFAATPVRGRARVLCFSPDHGATLAHLDDAALRAVIDAWCAETATLGHYYASVQVFENKGAMMGCSNPHPHGQIWASDQLPDEIVTEDDHQRDWLPRFGKPLLSELAEREADGERVVESNASWLAIVPYWACWPFETLLLPRFRVARLPDLDDARRGALAQLLGRLMRRYDALFGVSFPYSMGWHGAPFDGTPAAHWQLHAHIYPPLLRSATVRKFMVGYELLAEAQRDLTPEAAAQMLRAAQ